MLLFYIFFYAFNNFSTLHLFILLHLYDTGMWWPQTSGELDRALEEHPPSSRTGICFIVRGGRGGRGGAAGALQNELQQATGVHVSDQTVTPWGGA